jgi:hypothetical protein
MVSNAKAGEVGSQKIRGGRKGTQEHRALLERTAGGGCPYIDHYYPHNVHY